MYIKKYYKHTINNLQDKVKVVWQIKKKLFFIIIIISFFSSSWSACLSFFHFYPSVYNLDKSKMDKTKNKNQYTIKTLYRGND